MSARVALWLEEFEGEWFVIVSGPGIEIDRIGPYTRPEADAFIAGAKTFAPNYIGARPTHMTQNAAAI